MWFLVAAILCSSGMTITLRFSKSEGSNQISLAANYVVAALLCLVFMKDRQILPNSPDRLLALGLGVINGSLFVITLVLNRMNLRKNGTPLTASFSHLGVLLPTVLSMVLFAEQPSGKQWIGVVLAVIAILVINISPSKSERARFPLGLILLFTFGGCTDIMSKVFERQNIPQCDNLFLFYTFGVALIICLVWALVKRTPIRKEDIIIGIIIGIFNYTSTLFLLQAILRMEAFIVYPVYSVGVIVVINIINRLFLKETISKMQYLGMGIICVALLFL